MITIISSVIKILIPTNWTEAAEFSPLSNTHKLGLEGKMSYALLSLHLVMNPMLIDIIIMLIFITTPS